MSSLTKKDFISRVASRLALDEEAVRPVVQAFLNEVVSQLAEGQRIEFRDFGVFEVRNRAARTAQNPKTLQRVTVPQRRTVKFKPGRLMREGMLPTDNPPSEPMRDTLSTPREPRAGSQGSASPASPTSHRRSA